MEERGRDVSRMWVCVDMFGRLGVSSIGSLFTMMSGQRVAELTMMGRCDVF